MKLEIKIEKSDFKKFGIYKYFIILIVIVLLIWLRASFDSIIIILYFTFSILYLLESQISFSIGLFFIALAAILQIFKLDKYIELFSIWAFYFFSIGIITQISEFIKQRRRNK